MVDKAPLRGLWAVAEVVGRTMVILPLFHDAVGAVVGGGGGHIHCLCTGRLVPAKARVLLVRIVFAV